MYWTKYYLFKEGRLVVLKSTLMSLPFYFMSLFTILRKVSIRLEKNQRDFLWGDLGERKEMHLICWSNVCKDKKFGGLGLED